MKAIENAPIEVQQAMDNILDCFAGADGGGRFYNLCRVIDNISLNLNVENQEKSAKYILDVIIQFSRLIDISNTSVNK